MDMPSKMTLDLSSEIWAVADLMRDAIPASDYNKVILPLAVLRRLECALEPTRDEVVEYVEANKERLGTFNEFYCTKSKRPFYNVTPFRLADLGSAQTYKNLKKYVDGFSPNVREIFSRFDLLHACQKLERKGVLYKVCNTIGKFDLDLETVNDRTMSNIYEHLIQKFGEEVAENAEDFMTPRDVVRLAVSMVFAEDVDLMDDPTNPVVTLYDGCCGTCGFITDALDLLDEWRDRTESGAGARIVPYGEELTDETWAMGKASLLLRNEGDPNDVASRTIDLSSNIVLGNTLTEDAFPDMTFDFQVTNPPYGKAWSAEESDVSKEAALGFAGRFGAGLPHRDDGSMLFLQNVAKKMKPAEKGGGKAAIVLSGSPLFNGDAGSGPANIRRWLLDNDLIDCIVKLPDSIFYRTDISTYLWILSNRKQDGRVGYVQLIDASDRGSVMEKNQGKKRREVSKEDAEWIVRTYVDGHDHGSSVMVPVKDFKYRQISVERPWRLAVRYDGSRDPQMLASSAAMRHLAPEPGFTLVPLLQERAGEALDHADVTEIAKAALAGVPRTLADGATRPGVKEVVKAVAGAYGTKGADSPLVLNKNGAIVADPDGAIKENVPWGMSVEDFMDDFVLPWWPGAWVDETVVDDKAPEGVCDGEVGVVGADLAFNRYFYNWDAPRDPKQIASEIRAIDAELAGLLDEALS